MSGSRSERQVVSVTIPRARELAAAKWKLTRVIRNSRIDFILVKSAKSLR